MDKFAQQEELLRSSHGGGEQDYSEADAMRAARMHKRTRARYRQYLKKLVLGLQKAGANDLLVKKNGVDVLNVQAIEGCSGEPILNFFHTQKPKKSKKKSAADASAAAAPSDTASSSATTAEPSPLLGASSFEAYRSAIAFAFTDAGVEMSKSWDTAVQQWLRGLKNKQAAKRQSGARGEIGKKVFPKALYEELCAELTKDTRPGSIFTQAYFKLQWTLISRMVNVTKVNWSHMVPMDDHIEITHSVTKTDQSGESKAVKSCYANPFKPEVCLFLGMGIYLACNANVSDHFIFEGGNQDKRYGHQLGEFFREPKITAMLARYGLTPDDMGTHSVRKAGGTAGAAAPFVSLTTLCLRASWTLVSTMKKYIFREKGGDQMLGRVLACLPYSSAKFNALPPHFVREQNADVEKVLDMCFPSTEAKIPKVRAVLRVYLASVVFHADWIKETMPEDHPIFNTPLFADETLLLKLKPLVLGGVVESPEMQPTGTPPSIAVLGELAKCNAKIDAMQQLMVDTIKKTVEEAAIESGAVTAGVLRSVMADEFNRRGIGEVTEKSRDADDTAITIRKFMWGGKFRNAPAGFVLPSKCPLRVGLSLWFRGKPSAGICAYRSFNTDDLAGEMLKKERRKQQKVFSEWKKTMALLKVLAGSAGSIFDSVAVPTTQEVEHLYATAWPNVMKRSTTATSSRGKKSKRTRPMHWTVLTTAKRLRRDAK